MRVIAFVLDHRVVDQVLRHLSADEGHRERGPPALVDFEAAS